MTNRLMQRLVWIASFLLVAGGVSAQQVEYYHLDGIGSVRAISDANGNEIARHDYLPFGEEWNPTPSPDRLRFAGKERDTETGLDYLGARYLGQDDGRFRSVDSVMAIGSNINDPQGWNRYAYARNNPITLIDPDGKEWANAFMYLAGAQDALRSNLTFGLGRSASTNSDFLEGQAFGDQVSTVIGAFETAVGLTMDGGGLAASGTGVGAVVGVPAIAVGTAVAAHGATVAGAAMINLSAGRFVVDADGTVVDTDSTPRGSYDQPDGGRTDILQEDDHGAGRTHTHPPVTNTNPATGETFPKGTGPGRPVSGQEAQNISTGAAPRSKPRNR